MILSSPALFAILKIVMIFATILLIIWLRFPLWVSIMGGSILTAFINKLPIDTFIKAYFGVLQQSSFITLLLIIFLIMILSGLQAASGQSKKLVASLDHHMQNPRLRLVLFPALVGLLPMPGGALFSCPMLEEAAKDMKILPEKKAIINYWFRHIWEVAWPLYPGYILASSLLDLPLSTICTYTFPMVLAFFMVGWFCYMRELKHFIPDSSSNFEKKTILESKILIHALPMIITIGGAGLLVLLSTLYNIGLSTQDSFLISISSGIICAAIQGRKELKGKILKIIFSLRALNLLLVLFMIYAFKDIILSGEFIEALTSVGSSKLALYLLFFFFPFISGAITGVMVAYVGVSFPILLGIISQAGLQEQSLPLMLMALLAGNLGQMISPIHICYVVTCEYFKSGITKTWKHLPKAVLSLAVVYCLWVALLYKTGATF